MTYRPKLDPKRDLVGATPETLALALLGKKPKKRPKRAKKRNANRHGSSGKTSA